MAIGLKLRDVRKFGQKITKTAGQVGRKLSKVAEGVGSVAVPIVSAVNPALGAEVAAGVQAVSKFGKSTERLAGKAASRGEQLFKTAQQPLLGAREIVGAAKGAMKNPEATQIRIGDVVANRFKKPSRSIQRTEGGEVVNDWAPELPFANM